VTTFHLVGQVTSENPDAVRALLRELGLGTLASSGTALQVEGVMEGEDARDVNRRLLSALRRVERRTVLRSEWSAGGLTHRFFDYVPKGSSPDADLA
jgi:hypothetical protein